MMPVACASSVFAVGIAFATLPKVSKVPTEEPKCMMTYSYMIVAGLIALITGLSVCVSVKNNSIKTFPIKKGNMEANMDIQFTVSWATILTIVAGTMQFISSIFAMFRFNEKSRSEQDERDRGMLY